MTNATFQHPAKKGNAPILTFVRVPLCFAALCICLTAISAKDIEPIPKKISPRYSLPEVAPYDTIRISLDSFFNMLVKGANTSDTVFVIATSLDDKNLPKSALKGTLFSREKNFSFSLSDSLLLNYVTWSVSPRNNISHTPQGLLVTDLVLTHDSSRIDVRSKEQFPDSPIEVILQRANIRDLIVAFTKDTLLADGLVNAQLSISDFNKLLPAITGTMDVTPFSLNGTPVGNVHLEATRQNENMVAAKMLLTGNENDLTLTGNYYLDKNNQQFDGSLDGKRLSLISLQGFSKGRLTGSSGSLHGSMALNGSFINPQWKGALQFDTARFTVAPLGTTYVLNKEMITLDYPFVRLNEFTVRDSLNNTLTVNGQIESCSLTEYELALRVKSKSFSLVNSARAINNLVYGSAAADMDVQVTGTSGSPRLAGDVFIGGTSEVTMILPEKNIDKDAARSLVRFIDQDTFVIAQTRAARPADEQRPDLARFINYKLNLRVDTSAAMTIIIDPSTGDQLKVKGNANFHAGVDTSGNILLAGKYQSDTGSYTMNYQFLNKKFSVTDGSVIDFAGAPIDARINTTAEYIALTSPKELLGSEVGSVDPRLAHSFTQKVPFRVMLYLKGTLKRPSISFDIQLPQEAVISKQLRTTINNKLVQLREDEAATNKQVFALLALDRFVGEQSTDFFKGSRSGNGFNDLSRESVSGFLSAALDEIASDLFKGINIDLNLNSYKDFTNSDKGQRTDLNVEVSKNFLNDRLNVTVGKNFGIEGQDGSAKAAQQKASRFLPDVTVNYKLSQDGKYLMRAYNKNQFEVILDGYIVETGIAFLVTMDFDQFKELFLSKKMAE